MKNVSGVLTDITKLKELIEKHPDYPIAVVCSDNVNNGDFPWAYAFDVRVGIGEILDCEQNINDTRVFDDRDDFYECLEE